ncbi:hypothetical protein GCM10010329_86150 [Streptomyces spiroverticillatus]|uniref:UDP-N-acetylglucosamine kinase n=1 Tax=Streptomyces finlayi TaxID=67296 RepID=A0A918X9T2_9ACTN|nr:zeta toxin family protein [Streptomyces finlayi]GHA50954.1 hypothetical protein GCM10010329_86150 [Streptomyces spiroverticillatus]GHD20042.1 hypothetical protein GCM10010334_84210 [Streptomyces finlayi]
MTAPNSSSALLLTALPEANWSSTGAVAYEAAVEALSRTVGSYSAHLAAQDARPLPDRTARVILRHERTSAARTRDLVHTTDTDTIGDLRQRPAVPIPQPPQQPAPSYVLSPQENELIFTHSIVRDLLAPFAPQDQPVALYLLGQPGSGKSHVASLLLHRFAPHGGCANIDSDLYKPYHPRYAEAMALDDRNMAACMGPDGQAWMHRAEQWAHHHKINMLIQETAQNPPYLADMMKASQASGFRNVVLALGVARALSDQGILHRYHEQVKDCGRARLTVPAKADLSDRGILATARLIDAEQLAHETAVFRRGEHLPRYHNHLRDHTWARPPAFADAIERERHRPLSPAEDRDFRHVQAKLLDEMEPEWTSRLLDIAQRAPR